MSLKLYIILSKLQVLSKNTLFHTALQWIKLAVNLHFKDIY